MIFGLLLCCFLGLALSVAFGLTLARHAGRVPPTSASGTSTGRVAVLVPAAHDDAPLERCLASISSAAIPELAQVIVVLAGADGARPGALNHLGPSVMVNIVTGPPSGKAEAILRGLRQVDTEWVVLLDSDTSLRTDGLSRLLSLCRDDFLAVYGVVRTRRSSRRPVLDLAVDLDKALSHGVFRPGRAALGLWPNLPGQCYAIRSDVLRRVYSGRIGYLDDLVVTLHLASLSGRIAFLPEVVAEEEARESWVSYVIQRGRWWIGLIQAGLGIPRSPGRPLPAAIAWTLHAWLYYGWPVATASAMGILLLSRLWWPSLALAGIHALAWGYLCLCGWQNLASWDPGHAGTAPSRAKAIVLGMIVSLIPCLGAIAALVLLLAHCVKCRPGLARWSYIR